jgi:hypothetical protein
MPQTFLAGTKSSAEVENSTIRPSITAAYLHHTRDERPVITDHRPPPAVAHVLVTGRRLGPELSDGSRIGP